MATARRGVVQFENFECKLLSIHKLEIINEVDVLRLLPILVCKQIFSVSDERDILRHANLDYRADLFISLLSAKGPFAFWEFCSALEQVCPRILTSFLIGLAVCDQVFEEPFGDQLKARDLFQRLNKATQIQLDSVIKQRLREDELEREHELERKTRAHSGSDLRDVESIMSLADFRALNSNERQPFPTSGSDRWNDSDVASLEVGRQNEELSEDGDKVAYETQTVTLTRTPTYGFGIAVSGGRDNPQFGDPAIFVTDVLRHGPAEGKLTHGDHILSVNGTSLDNVDHATAISILRDSGQLATMVVRRKVIIPRNTFEQPFNVTLSKTNKKDDFGLVLGYKLYIKELIPNGLAARDGNLREGDTILKLNDASIENLSLNDVKKQIDKCKDKLQLLISRSSSQVKNDPSQTDVSEHRTRTTNQSDTPQHQSSSDFSHQSTGVTETGQDTIERFQPPQPGLGETYHPAEQSPASTTHGYGYPVSPTSFDTGSRLMRSEPRYISFRKEGGVGIRISGGNQTGIFVAKVAPQTPAEQRGLREGDMILKVNDIDLFGKTREEAVLLLLGLRDHVSLLVQYRRLEYEKLMTSGGTGDYFCIRTHFSYTVTEHREMSFGQGDIFLITDTLYGGVVGSWQATRIVRNPPNDLKKGIIPNLSRAEQLVLAQYADKENLPVDDRHAGVGSSQGSSSNSGGFFRKKSSEKTKSLSRDNWSSAFLGPRTSKFPAYERVVLRDPGFIRPVVIFGSLADVARTKLVSDFPERYEAPEVTSDGDQNAKAGIIKLSNIREIINKRKHCVLDVTPSAVDRLNDFHFAPIVVFLRAEDKHSVKELRHHWARQSAKNHRKLYEQAVRLEKLYSHIFTFTIPLTNGSAWYRKMNEAIVKSQLERVWMSEVKPDVSREEVLFPLGERRLSFIASPEIDFNASKPSENPSAAASSLRASSDPSINNGEEPSVTTGVSGTDSYYQAVVSSPKPPVPPVHHQWSAPVSHNYADTQRVHRDYSSYYSTSQTMSPRSRPKDESVYRTSIDPYATLTPSERLRRPQHGDRGSQYYDVGLEYPPTQPESSYLSPKVITDPPQSTSTPHAASSRYLGYPDGHLERQPPPLPSGGDARNYSYQRGVDYERQLDNRKVGTAASSFSDDFSQHPSTQGQPQLSITQRPTSHSPSRLHHMHGMMQAPADTSFTDSANDRVDYLFRRQAQNDQLASYHSTRTAGYNRPDYLRNSGYGRSFEQFSRDDEARINATEQTNIPSEPSSRQGVAVSLTNGSSISYREEGQSEVNNKTRTPVNGPTVDALTSAFESYKKPYSQQEHHRENSIEAEEHSVLATARGVFDSSGGVLESIETGVSIMIPRGAIQDGVKQEIYFKVCQDNSIMPPLDKEKGETLLSPLVMCGPHGLKFKLPVELRLPHSASVNPESWSFALKSSDSPSGNPNLWQNMALAGVEGPAQGHIGKSTVSVLVDHF